MAKLMVFGANSPIGRSVKKYCIQEDFGVIGCSRHNEDKELACANCLEINEVDRAIKLWQPSHVISLVGINGNIQMNHERPAEICHETVQMNMNIMECCLKTHVKKVVIPLSSCGYSSEETNWVEKNYLKGEVHDSVLAHGFARRFLLVLGKLYNKQYGNRFVFPILNNNFGPEDHWKRPEKLKVFGTLIKRFVEAKRNKTESVTIWGTGNARREGILFAESGRLITEVALNYEDFENPINLGYGTDLSIKEIATLIGKAVGFEGKIEWDHTKPEGQMKKLLDVSKATKLGFVCNGSLEQGIVDTARWYMEHGK